MPPDRQHWIDDGLLRRTIERQLSRKPTLLPGAASGAIGEDLSITKHLGAGSNMRIADLGSAELLV
jgi:hypothetical protein